VRRCTSTVAQAVVPRKDIKEQNVALAEGGVQLVLLVEVALGAAKKNRAFAVSPSVACFDGQTARALSERRRVRKVKVKPAVVDDLAKWSCDGCSEGRVAQLKGSSSRL